MTAQSKSLRITAANASPDEAAAIVAAVEQFLRQTSPVAAAAETGLPAWQQAALREGVARDPELRAVTHYAVHF